MVELVVLYTGRQGAPGPSTPGEDGPQGPGFRARGVWSPGTEYAPGDAVTSDSSIALGLKSLYVQRWGSSTTPSLTDPRNDSARWLEVGPADLAGVTGTIWRVIQLNHGFTSIGTPIGFDGAIDKWVTANNKVGEPVALGLVREVVSPNEFVVQTTGEITNLDPAVLDGVTEFTPGRMYYVSALRGRLTEIMSPGDTNFASNAMLVATSPTSGVVLQWQQTPNVVGRRPVGFRTFSYTAAAGQTVFSGPDLNGNVLVYDGGDQTQVFADGLVLSPLDEFEATTGVSVTLTTPAAAGQRVDIRVPAELLQAIAPATSLVVDNIAPQFDGVTRRFPLTVGGGNPVALGPAQNVLVWIDGAAQEPTADYITLAGLNTATDIEFPVAPAPGTRFWAVVGVAISNLSFLEADTLVVTNLEATNFNIGTTEFEDLTVTGTATVENAVVTSAEIGTLTVAAITGPPEYAFATFLDIDEGTF